MIRPGDIWCDPVDRGDEYEVIGFARPGRESMSGGDFVVYRELSTDFLFFSEPRDFTSQFVYSGDFVVRSDEGRIIRKPE